MIVIIEQLITGVGMFFVIATVVMPLIGLLWHFIGVFLKVR